MAKRIALVFFLILTASSLSGQYYLQLKKRNKVIHTYAAGDNISFKLKGDDYLNDQMIIGLADSIIKFRLFEVAFSDIEFVTIRDRKQYGIDLTSTIAITAGELFLVGDQFNQLFIENEGFGPSSETLIIGGSIIGFGLLLRLLKKRKFKIKAGGYRLFTTDFYVPKSRRTFSFSKSP
ncbi:MAG: hypothetical protein AAF519_05090 [Bacteroidota bacterium]